VIANKAPPPPPPHLLPAPSCALSVRCIRSTLRSRRCSTPKPTLDSPRDGGRGDGGGRLMTGLGGGRIIPRNRYRRFSPPPPSARRAILRLAPPDGEQWYLSRLVNKPPPNARILSQKRGGGGGGEGRGGGERLREEKDVRRHRGVYAQSPAQSLHAPCSILCVCVCVYVIYIESRTYIHTNINFVYCNASHQITGALIPDRWAHVEIELARLARL